MKQHDNPLDDLVAQVLGQPKQLARPDDQSYVLPRADTLGPSQVDWLWEGYLLSRKVTGVDGKGGSGKSRLVMGIAACGSHGVFPFGYEMEPIRKDPWATLILATEDDEEELADTFKESGGNPNFFIPYDCTKAGRSNIVLDDKGLRLLERYVSDNGVKLVMPDPILEYAPPGAIKNQNDNDGITRWFREIRAFARDIGVAFVFTRHWAKAAVGREAHERGAGGESWRNSARGQFVVFAHPACRRGWTQALVLPGRNTMRVQYADPFGIEITDRGQTFIRPRDLKLHEYIEKYPDLKAPLQHLMPADVPRGDRGPTPARLVKAMDAILVTLNNGRIYKSALIDGIINSGDGHAKTTVYDAFNTLITQGRIVNKKGMIEHARDDIEYDPYGSDALFEEDEL